VVQARTIDRQALDSLFRDALELDDDADLSDMAYGSSPAWDSVAHLQLLTAIEDALGIELEGDDVVSATSYSAFCRIIESRGLLVDDKTDSRLVR